MIVATAGHIDHGKTTLVRALTGIDTDGLPEEKARGISIDVGFAHATLDGQTIGFVDVPGHERFIRNMLSGVYAVGHVLLVIAADDGPMPQTSEHLSIVGLLGVARITVAITKRDRVDEARLALVEREARALLAGAGYRDVTVLAVSAATGAGMDELRRLLASAAADEVHGDAQSGALARFVVDRVFSASGSGTIARGTVISGAISTGDTLTISPGGATARVRRLQTHGKTVESAHAGQRCAINLANVEQEDVARGDWLVAPAAHHPSGRIGVRVRVLAGEAKALRHWTPVHVHLGAADIPARIALRRGEAIPPGEANFAQLLLQRPVNAVHGDRFILRDQSASRTIGGGSVIDPFPPVRRRALWPVVAEALSSGDPRTSLATMLAAGGDGVDLDWLAQVFNLPLDAVLAMVPADATVVKLRRHLAFSAAAVAQLRQGLTALVQRFHAENQSAEGMEMRQLHRELARTLDFEAFSAIVRLIAPKAGMVLQGSRLRILGHDSTDNPRDGQAWRLIEPVLEDAEAMIPSLRELSAQSGVPLPQLRDLVHRKSTVGQLVRITPERFALPETVDMLRDAAKQTASRQPGGMFSAAQYRDAIRTGRGLAIEILECLDRLGATVRRGDLREIRGNSESS
jgi:selenocysteine-specific elongation factor